MDLKSDRPFWPVASGLVEVYPPLDQDLRCDALVVGGGITGAILANALAEKGVDTVVVDRRDIGHGSTSASTALLQYEIDVPLHELREKIDRRHAERAYRMGIEAIRDLRKVARGTADFAMQPSLLLAKSKRDLPFLKREFAARRDAGIPLDLIEERELRTTYGLRRPAALVSSHAASLNPYVLTHEIFRRWRGNGIRVFDRTEILSYRPSRSGVAANTSRRTRIQARRVFFATGFETKRILSGKFVKLRSTYALASEPADPTWWKKRCLLWETGDPYLYARLTPDGRVIAGGEDDYVLSGPGRDTQTERKSRLIQRKFQKLFPEAQIERAFWWSGVFGSTRDGLPYIGTHPEFPKGFFALGFGGNGITFSAMAARILTDAYLDRQNADAAIYRFERY